MTKDSLKDGLVEFTPIVAFQHYFYDGKAKKKTYIEYFIVDVSPDLETISEDDRIKLLVLADIATSKTSIPLANPVIKLEEAFSPEDPIVLNTINITYGEMIESLLKAGLIQRMVKSSSPLREIRKFGEELSPDNLGEINAN